MVSHYRNINNKAFKIILFIVALFFVSACSKEILLNPEIERSVLIYFAGNNNLSSDLKGNIEALKRGFIPENGNVLVYLDVPNANPKLFRLVMNRKTNVIEEEFIEQYAADERSTNPAVLTKLLNRMRELFPAKEYGLILSSHGCGWVPAAMFSSTFFKQRNAISPLEYARIEDLPTTKAFSQYGSDPGMELDEIAAAVPYHLSFILFDACFMGSVEVAYALRHVTDYLIASPAEILSTGFPYDKIIQPMFLHVPDLSAVCNAFYSFYNELPNEYWRSATVGLYQTESLDELANVVKSIFIAHRTTLNHFSPDKVQHYANASIFYDLDNFLMQLATPSEYALFKESLDKVVLHKQATSRFYSLVTSAAYITVNYFGGISTYIPVSTQQALCVAYKETAWNRAVRLVE